MKTKEFPSGPRQCNTHTFFSIIYCRGKALEFKTEIGGSPATAFSFSHVDVDVGVLSIQIEIY